MRRSILFSSCLDINSSPTNWMTNAFKWLGNDTPDAKQSSYNWCCFGTHIPVFYAENVLAESWVMSKYNFKLFFFGICFLIKTKLSAQKLKRLQGVGSNANDDNRYKCNKWYERTSSMTQHPWNKTHQTAPSLHRPYAPAARKKSCSFTSLFTVRQTVCLSARNLRAFFGRLLLLSLNFWWKQNSILEWDGGRRQCVAVERIKPKWISYAQNTVGYAHQTMNDFGVCVNACGWVRICVFVLVCVLRQEPGNRNSLIGGRRMMNATEIVRRGGLQQQQLLASWALIWIKMTLGSFHIFHTKTNIFARLAPSKCRPKKWKLNLLRVTFPTIELNSQICRMWLSFISTHFVYKEAPWRSIFS